MLQMENNFNYILSQTRQTIERAFALLKGRFRRLKYLDMSKVDLIPTILACCILHNICLNNNDDDDEVENYIAEGRENEQNRENNEECVEIGNCNEGIIKRNYLATILFRRN